MTGHEPLIPKEFGRSMPFTLIKVVELSDPWIGQQGLHRLNYSTQTAM